MYTLPQLPLPPLRLPMPFFIDPAMPFCFQRVATHSPLSAVPDDEAGNFNARRSPIADILRFRCRRRQARAMRIHLIEGLRGMFNL